MWNNRILRLSHVKKLASNKYMTPFSYTYLILLTGWKVLALRSGSRRYSVVSAARGLTS